MKKFLSGILFLLISVFIFADSSASVEGVIEVAGKDELPAGYFGKAAGYLPGDSVSITNPNTGITLQILNLGTLDASGGIAILISEESAKSLGIERNSGVKVKLAPRSGYFDETVSGNAVLDEKTLPAAKEEPVSDVSAEPAVQAGPEAASQPAENAAVSVEPAAPVAVAGVPLIADTEDNAEEEDAEVAAVEDEAETPVDEIDSEDETDFSDEEKLSAEPVEEEVSADDEPSVESVEEETEPVIVEAPAPTEECEVPEEPYEDYESVEDGFLESKEAVEQPSPAEESEVEAVTVEEPDPIEEETEDLPEEENAELVIVEEPQEEEPETPTEDETEEEAVTVEEPSPIEEDSAEENQMEEVSEPEEVVAEPNAEPEAQSSGESESSDYAPIVLVPSEPESPEPPVDASIENEPIEIVPVESVPEEKKTEPEPLQTEYPVSIQDYVVSSESALASNCYYIQIATMGNIKNIENILVKYSKYPVSLIPAGKNYRVLVGPLSVDEYGAVLAKFKNAGFKDAFVRKR
ncbi:SPOR domain-containing protein [Treponema succinifaciens]|uniref:SPOR domain-containing protein n=1 Tax=Treponema succinifaciens TaxID=167 RepID=UPI0023F0B98B|nr:SPOR domain-containing protein [Treponema succinifaciens]